MAAVVLQHLVQQAGLADQVEVDSAGVDGWHIGDGADPRTLAVLRSAGYDGDAHRAIQFKASWIADRDLILVADRGHLRRVRALAPRGADLSHVRLLREFDPEAVAAGTLDLHDPYYDDDAAFDTCLADVLPACHGVLAHVRDQVTQDTPRA